jgi:hypothetical protein
VCKTNAKVKRKVDTTTQAKQHQNDDTMAKAKVMRADSLLR